MRLPVDSLERVAFCILVLLLIFRIFWSIRLLQAQHSSTLQRKYNRWHHRPAGLLPALLVLLALAGIVLGKTSSAEIYGRLRQPSRNQQIALPLDLHIPSVSPVTTYTVIAKFRVKGRSYTSRPLQIRFGVKRSSYPLMLYYDAGDPARNSWSKLRIVSPAEILREAVFGGICLLLVHLALEWLEIRWAPNGAHKRPSV